VHAGRRQDSVAAFPRGRVIGLEPCARLGNRRAERCELEVWVEFHELVVACRLLILAVGLAGVEGHLATGDASRPPRSTP